MLEMQLYKLQFKQSARDRPSRGALGLLKMSRANVAYDENSDLTDEKGAAEMTL